MDALAIIGERRIREAIARGDFDDLPGRGRRLEIDDLSRIPEDLRLGYLMLRMAGFVSDELALRGECLRLQDLIAACTQADEREVLRRRLNQAVLRWRRWHEARGAPVDPKYARRIEAHLSDEERAS